LAAYEAVDNLVVIVPGATELHSTQAGHPQLDRQRARERVEGGFAGVVGADVGQPGEAADRAHVDDPPAGAGLDQGPADRARERRGAQQVDPQDLVPLRQRGVDDRLVEGVDPGVVDQAPQAAQPLGGVDGRGGDLSVGDVAGDGRARAGQLVGQLGQRVARAGHRHHRAAARADPPRDLRADAARGAGDDDGAPIQAKGVAHGWRVYSPTPG